jgi:hypothetical protein
MNRLTRFLAAFGLAAGIAAAQPPLGPPPGGALDIERLSVLLDLDAYQKGEVERVLAEQREARLAARERRAAGGDPPAPEELRASREHASEEMLGKLGRTLSEQQLTKLKLLVDAQRGPRGQGAPPPRLF